MAEPAAPLTAAAIAPDLWCPFDQYVHGDIDRRAFLDRAARVAAASGTTGPLLCLPDSARTSHVRKRWRPATHG